ncbi:Cell division protein FtsL [Psychrobacter sp. SC65A.3]|jgi:cell division protein FtsL|uniref:cell division protein FtsL n=1 Tax=unclassified Psychrobacter TaxID=196806 RepID=UPI0021DA2763|nr:cell division protein FtsL [Psychrobacter sp. SC65A.3]WAI86638.1 Cell division protein FtsL [Psychrobacter sp. SC65A.3]
MAISDKPANRRAATPSNTDVGALFVRKFKISNIYVAILVLLAAGIVWSGIKTAEGVQQYHQDYKTLQDMKKQERKLQVEHQRLLIEQQTFSATPQIASRAVAELGMFSPTLKDKLIIQPGAATAVALVDPDASTPDTLTTNDSDVFEADAVSDVPVKAAATDSDLAEAGQ